jgi:hypothetical protein
MLPDLKIKYTRLLRQSRVKVVYREFGLVTALIVFSSLLTKCLRCKDHA